MSIKNIEFFPTNATRDFFKIRNKILNLNIKKLDKLGIKVPSIEQSINLLIKELNENKSLQKYYNQLKGIKDLEIRKII